MPVIGFLLGWIFSPAGEKVNRRKAAGSCLCRVRMGVILFNGLLTGLFALRTRADIDPDQITAVQAVIRELPQRRGPVAQRQLSQIQAPCNAAPEKDQH